MNVIAADVHAGFALCGGVTKEEILNLYVGNLSYQATEEDLQDAFTAYGEVASASIVRDRFSGESRGFGFVEMPSTLR